MGSGEVRDAPGGTDAHQADQALGEGGTGELVGHGPGDLQRPRREPGGERVLRGLDVAVGRDEEAGVFCREARQRRHVRRQRDDHVRRFVVGRADADGQTSSLRHTLGRWRHPDVVARGQQARHQSIGDRASRPREHHLHVATLTAGAAAGVGGR